MHTRVCTRPSQGLSTPTTVATPPAHGPPLTPHVREPLSLWLCLSPYLLPSFPLSLLLSPSLLLPTLPLQSAFFNFFPQLLKSWKTMMGNGSQD